MHWPWSVSTQPEPVQHAPTGFGSGHGFGSHPVGLEVNCPASCVQKVTVARVQEPSLVLQHGPTGSPWQTPGWQARDGRNVPPCPSQVRMSVCEQASFGWQQAPDTTAQSAVSQLASSRNRPPDVAHGKAVVWSQVPLWLQQAPGVPQPSWMHDVANPRKTAAMLSQVALSVCWHESSAAQHAPLVGSAQSPTSHFGWPTRIPPTARQRAGAVSMHVSPVQQARFSRHTEPPQAG